MIEIKLLEFNSGKEERWIESTKNIIIENINFKRADVRIDGVTYTEYSEEFVKAFNKAKLWMRLKE